MSEKHGATTMRASLPTVRAVARELMTAAAGIPDHDAEAWLTIGAVTPAAAAAIVRAWESDATDGSLDARMAALVLDLAAMGYVVERFDAQSVTLHAIGGAS